jgi:hypothetical protein
MPEMLKLGLDAPASARVDSNYQLDVGGVVGQSFKVTLANLVPFSLVGMLVHVPVFLMLLLAAGLPMAPETASLLTTGSGLVEHLAGLVLSGALTFGVVQHLRGQRLGVGEVVAVGLRSAVRVFLVSLLAGLATLVGVLLCIVPGIIVSCMLWVAVPVAVMEDAGVLESMNRSQTLTLGTRMSVFAVNLLMGLIVGGAGIAIFGGSTMLVALIGGAGEASPALLAGGQLVGTVLAMPFQCLQAASVAIGYHDLRVHREGAGVEDLVGVFE